MKGEVTNNDNLPFLMIAGVGFKLVTLGLYPQNLPRYSSDTVNIDLTEVGNCSDPEIGLLKSSPHFRVCLNRLYTSVK